MKGVASKRSGGVSWPGGAPCIFDLDQVRALGKQSTYGSFVTRYVVLLLDDREVFVKLDEQSADEQAWIRRLARRELAARREARLAGFAGGAPTRDCPEVIHWIEVEDRREIPAPSGDADRRASPIDRVKLPPVERVQMPRRHDGTRVGDRWLCAKGHLHPSRAHAIKCQQRARLETERTR